MTSTLLPQVATATSTANELLPLLREHSEWMEENRTQHPEVLEAVRAAGLFDLRRPRHLGGDVPSYEDIFTTVSTLARGDGSTAWLVAVNAITSWMAAHLSDLAIEEIFAEPGVQTCGTLSPGGRLEKTPDGSTTLSGSWRFISGALTSDWQIVIAVTDTPDGHGVVPAIAAVPLSDLDVVDDWHTMGLRGTGSVTTIANHVVVPPHRILLLPQLLDGKGESAKVTADPAFSSPLVSTASGLSAAVAPGLATAALEQFIERAADRGITYTAYEQQDQAPVTHLQVGQASLLVEESTLHATWIAHKLDRNADDPTPWSIEDRVAARARLGRSTEQALTATRLVADASGGSSIYLDNSFQRVHRDLQAMNQHALISPATNRELQGRILCGLEPTTLYI